MQEWDGRHQVSEGFCGRRLLDEAVSVSGRPEPGDMCRFGCQTWGIFRTALALRRSAGGEWNMLGGLFEATVGGRAPDERSRSRFDVIFGFIIAQLGGALARRPGWCGWFGGYLVGTWSFSGFGCA
jgi:hypothetical protein